MICFFFFFIPLALVDLTLFRFYILSYFFESCLNFIVLVSFISSSSKLHIKWSSILIASYTYFVLSENFFKLILIFIYLLFYLIQTKIIYLIWNVIYSHICSWIYLESIFAITYNTFNLILDHTSVTSLSIL